ncbi:MAG: helix-turn-helix domain containing protein [Burkholderiaceae bacterium]|nr:TetR/AcrR family transcriptional regulator [Burkholderiales bacterium]MCZ8101729.1 helix-turn-helix domain containing protein [Burkholderiales bacterium]MCZ8340892.1 helix-turn-helix domain containing protein [Burkholderiaceae bacterium]
MNLPPPRKSFRETQFELREEAILDATNRLLGDKGYEAMSMDDIATEVGIAKGSLYKHFESKEALAGAVMVRLLEQTRAALAAIPSDRPAIERLEALLRWTLSQRLSGSVPHLPSTSPALQTSLMSNREYMDSLMTLSDEIGEMIQRARAEGAIRASLRDEFVLYTLYARTCDPTLEFLKAGGAMSDAEIVEQMVSACFRGMAA